MPGDRLASVSLAVLLAACLSVVAGCGAPAPVSPRHPITHDFAVNDPQFRRVVTGLLGHPLVEGNRVDTLLNGDEIFPAMLESIRAAEHTITFETFIYWSGEIGRQFAEALAERARAGVKIHVVIDAIGSSKIDKDLLGLMTDAGVEVEQYHKLKWYNLTSSTKINYRTHRKLMVVDGRVGYIGGVGIADVWLGDGRRPEQWRDNHYRVTGPIVAYLQGAFNDNWLQITGELLDGEHYFPPLEATGDLDCQVFASSPEGGQASMELMLLLSIAAAEDTIYLATAYFLPDESVLDALLAARERGVTVKVLVPGEHIDFDIVRSASRSVWPALLEAGVEIYEYRPTMFHAKVLVVDGLWSSIGSANLDPRSLRLNDEANLNVLSAPFAARQVEVLEADLRHARRYTPALLESERSTWDRVTGWFASWFSPVL